MFDFPRVRVFSPFRIRSWFGLMALIVIGLYCAFILCAVHALAQASAPPSADIPLAPFAALLQQWLTAIATACMPILTLWAVQKLASFLHVKATAAQEDRLGAMVATAAGSIIAAGSASIATETIHTNDPRIANAVNALPAKARVLANTLGVTPDDLAKMVQGEVGRLQAQAPALVPAPAVPIAASVAK